MFHVIVWFCVKESTALEKSTLYRKQFSKSGAVQFYKKAAPMAEWLRPLFFSALNCSSHVRQAKFCLRVVRWFFSGGPGGDLPFSPRLTVGLVQNKSNNLEGP